MFIPATYSLPGSIPSSTSAHSLPRARASAIPLTVAPSMSSLVCSIEFLLFIP